VELGHANWDIGFQFLEIYYKIFIQPKTRMDAFE